VLSARNTIMIVPHHLAREDLGSVPVQDRVERGSKAGMCAGARTEYHAKGDLMKTRILPVVLFLANISPCLGISGGQPSLAGRVVDWLQRPIAGARVAATPLMVLPLRQALHLETRTDANGVYRFDAALGDMDYCLEFWAAGHTYQTGTSRVGEFCMTTLRLAPVHTLSGTVRRAQAGTKILLLGEKAYAREVVASQDGRFEFHDVPEDIGQGVLYAHDKGLYSQYEMVTRQRNEVDLTLDASARIEGRCLADGSNTPISACRIIARPQFMSGFALETQSLPDGTYRFDSMPSGSYIVYATHAEWFQPPTRGDLLEPREIPAEAGRTAACDIIMRNKFRVEGTVFGPDGLPAAGVTVAIPSAIEPIYETSYAITRSGPDGRFAVYTHGLHPSFRTQSVDIAAFSDALGAGHSVVAKSSEASGETPVYKNIEIRLAGRMRISGYVRDSKGTPLSDIGAYVHPYFAPHRRTDASGFYDLNWFPLPSDAGMPVTVTFRAPRPHDGDMSLLVPASQRKPARRPEPGAVYMLHTSTPIAAQHNKALELNVALSPADLLTFEGSVTDASGLPVSQAQVMLFAGSAKGDEWLEGMHPERMRNAVLSPGRLACVPLARTVTDMTGGFTLWVVRESSESLRIQHPGVNVDPNLFSLGVESLGGAHAVIADIRMNGKQTEKRVSVHLP
jgi:hypothetical protein